MTIQNTNIVMSLNVNSTLHSWVGLSKHLWHGHTLVDICIFICTAGLVNTENEAIYYNLSPHK